MDDKNVTLKQGMNEQITNECITVNEFIDTRVNDENM